MPTPRCLPYGPDAVAEAARRIADGQCVAVPTETVYGLAADATHAQAVASIYAAKGRPSFNPLIVHLPDRAAAEALAHFDENAGRLADAFWPGPLTLVLPLREDSGIASLVTAGLSTIALRVPAHRAMQALLAATGRPLAAPSANASGGISPTRAEHVAASLKGRIPLVIEDGPTERGLESTILACTDGTVRLLRPGPITAEQVAAITGVMPGPAGSGIEAPGQLASHYAPGKPVRLDATAADADEWLIGFGPVRGDDTLSAAGNLTEAAARLFDCLHRADAAPKARIAVAPVPRDGLGAAINDRLARAAV
ncbi:L-threonylcarbamoyladenylate synthase [Sphingomonas desiccabilis]|uniref:Threonylcarbamoyl-AMP synthase n=1 Tax=Sphingomonas desiccabilis TaxID=429134 RepID=A0A4V1QP10_9SPHN|nr:L-threonylcarbamoyladenylate synthase [Sphingomonas desiccabilis]MBB3911741.1 L-threonylcarbamoyladenylate synthase [Sphingomonas desiccabilis]RXZ31534.1 threonylcarbamoyl-AMP synthase [Sphingomonas desiccabilis]